MYRNTKVNRGGSRRIATYVAIFVLFLLETTVFDKLRLFGARPEVLLIATIFFGFHFGLARGAEIGVFSGLLKDLFSVTAFGINTVAFLLAGVLSGFIRGKFFRDNILTQFLVCAVSVYIISGVHFLYLSEISKNGVSAEFWRIPVYKGIYTGCLSPLVFSVLGAVFKPGKNETI